MIKHYWNGSILTVESDSGSSAADLKGPKGETGPRGPRGLKGERGGGAQIEDGIISTETTWSSSAIMDNFAEYMSVEGNPVQCEPIANMPLHVLTSFEAKQEGSGEPYPAGGGKNLFDVNSRNNSYSGLSVDENDWITIEVDNTSGTANTYGSIYTPISTALKTNTPYAIVSEIKEITAESNIQIIGGTTSSNMAQFIETYARTGAGTRVTVQTTRGSFDGCKTMLRTNYIIPAGIKGKVVFRISVLEDTTITESNFVYQPYSNIRPIVGYDSISLTRCGKNLFDKNNYTPLMLYINCDTKTYISYTDERTVVIPIKPNTTYTVKKSTSTVLRLATSVDFPTKNGVITNCVRYDDDGKRTDALHITSGSNDKWLAVQLFADSSKDTEYFNIPANIEDLQIEIGETATDYESFKGDTFTFALGSTYYGGVLDWNKGELIVNKKGIVLEGSETWQKSAYGNHYNMILADTVPTKETENHIIYGSHCISIPYADRGKYTKLVVGITLNNKIEFRNTGYETIAEWTEYLMTQYNAGIPVQVVYELAEPQTIQLTAQEIKAIKGINTLSTNADNLQVIGRIDTMKQLSELAARVAALEKKLGGE